MKWERSDNRVSAVAMYVFGLSLLGFGILAIAATMLHDPWSRTRVDIAVTGLGALTLISVWTYFVPRGIPAAISVCLMSSLTSILVSLLVMGKIRRSGVNAPDWLEWIIAFLILCAFSPWVVKRTSAGYRGELYDE